MGVWIEILDLWYPIDVAKVTPYVGVWIEIKSTLTIILSATTSPPMWGCGLKSFAQASGDNMYNVTPYVGVWIEIPCDVRSSPVCSVTPYVGVWIEILKISLLKSLVQSPPMWGCGLK